MSAKSIDEWMKKVHNIQVNKISPEIREHMMLKAKRQRVAMLQQRKCKKMQSATRKSVLAFSKAMHSARATNSAKPGSAKCAYSTGRAELQEVQVALANNEEDIFDSACSDNTAVEVSSEVLAQEDLVEHLEEEEAAENKDNLEFALENLRQEPDSDEERECKFGLYTSYLETVERLRIETFSFWEESKAGFEPPAARVIERDLANIDSEDNMGMPQFSTNVWFVYDMCRKVKENGDKINAVLRSIRTKLDLLSKQDECPMCLEQFDAINAVPVYLSCCHAVCKDCWAHWKEVSHRAFCPLCRNVEFCEHVVTRFNITAAV